MSDLWVEIYAGKRWMEDNGQQRVSIHVVREVQVTTQDWPFDDPDKFTDAFAVSSSELQKRIKEELAKIGEDVYRKKINDLENEGKVIP